MIVVPMKATILVFIVEGERLQQIGPPLVLFPFDLHQDLGLENEDRGIVV